jgi:hypothetical protein
MKYVKNTPYPPSLCPPRFFTIIHLNHGVDIGQLMVEITARFHIPRFIPNILSPISAWKLRYLYIPKVRSDT